MTLNVRIPQLPQSTNNKNNIQEDDSENDSDYVPKNVKNDGSESSDSSDSDADSAPLPKKKRKLDRALTATVTGPAVISEEDERAQKEKTRQQLWEDFQASLTSPNPSSLQNKVSTPKLVKVVKKYRFAGEDVIKMEEVPEDSPDAKKWPRWDASMSLTESAFNKSTNTVPNVENGSGQGDENTKTPVPNKPAPRRKTRKSLDAMFASATASVTASALSKFNSNADAAALSKLAEVKGHKLTTLGKSAMDWNSHLQSIDEGSKEEMEKNRRNGGSYLSKVEFLQRVEERVENAAEEGRSKRRRV